MWDNYRMMYFKYCLSTEQYLVVTKTDQMQQEPEGTEGHL